MFQEGCGSGSKLTRKDEHTKYYWRQTISLSILPLKTGTSNTTSYKIRLKVVNEELYSVPPKCPALSSEIYVYFFLPEKVTPLEHEGITE